MALTPEQVHDLAVSHRIGLSRYSTGVVRKVLALLNRTERSIVERLARTSNETVSGQRLDVLLAELRRIQRQGWGLVDLRLRAEMGDLAAAEALFALRLAGVEPVATVAFSPIPSTGQIVAAVNSRPFQGRLLREWLAEAEEGAARRVRDAVRQGFVEGMTTPDIVRTIRGTKAAQYRDGIMETSRRGAEAMVRTALTHTANTAAQATWEANGDIVKGWQFVATLDLRTTLTCASLHGKKYALGKGPMPPRHINCLVGSARVSTSSRVSTVFKRWYDGDVVVIRTATGKELTCTPNHPILTDGGWIAAGLLNVGGHVVCDGGIKRVGLVNLDDENVEARIEDVAEAFLRHEQVSAVPVPTTAEDFHGDGVDGQVAIVAAHRGLDDGGEAPLDQHGRQHSLGFGSVRLPFVSGSSRKGHFGVGSDPTASSYLGGAGEGFSLGGRSAAHAGSLLLGSVPQGNASFGQRRLDGARTASEAIGDATDTDAGQEHLHDAVGVQGDSPPTGAREREAAICHLATDHIAADALLARQITDGDAGPITLDKVVNVERRKFAGHVFNLETETNWYVSDGIVTHNCRSTSIPILDPIPGVDPLDLPSYDAWLRRQSPETQADILGVAKARLFREGGLTVDRFTDNKGRTLTLEELRRRDATAFERAGLG
jgi:hypothetical protein